MNELLGAIAGTEVVVAANGDDENYQGNEANTLNIQVGAENLAPPRGDEEARRHHNQASGEAGQAKPEIELPMSPKLVEHLIWHLTIELSRRCEAAVGLDELLGDMGREKLLGPYRHPKQPYIADGATARMTGPARQCVKRGTTEANNNVYAERLTTRAERMANRWPQR